MEGPVNLRGNRKTPAIDSITDMNVDILDLIHRPVFSCMLTSHSVTLQMDSKGGEIVMLSNNYLLYEIFEFSHKNQVVRLFRKVLF